MSRAWKVAHYGEPKDVLHLQDTIDPVAADGQIRVRVTAASCNFADILLCRGQYQQRPKPPFTPGLEVCGWVDQLGAGVDATLSGRRVVAQPQLPHGGFADYALVNADAACLVPQQLDDSSAAAMHLTYLTAWLALHRRGAIRSGDTVVVTAATSGVGSAALQIAVAARAFVIALVPGPEKAATAAALGADVVIDRSATDVIAEVKAAAPRGADIVFESVGGDAYTQATKYIAFEGRIIVVGFAGGAIPNSALNHPMVKNYTIAGLHWALYQQHRPDLVRVAQASIFEMAVAGTLDPLISTSLSLDGVPKALDDLAHGRTTGKTIITT
jgi:NADPH2:quinone reductase